MKRILVCLALLASCGKGGGGNSDKLGGPESVSDSFSCVLSLPSPDGQGGEDKVRGFLVKVTVFQYVKGSVAATLEHTYKFNEKDSDTVVVSKLFAQNETKHKLESDFLLAKIDVKAKQVDILKKFDVGDVHDMECK
jgi:hypothetical protein